MELKKWNHFKCEKTMSSRATPRREGGGGGGRGRGGGGWVFNPILTCEITRINKISKIKYKIKRHKNLYVKSPTLTVEIKNHGI